MEVFILKKLLSVLALFVVLLAAFCLPAQAAENTNDFVLFVMSHENREAETLIAGEDETVEIRLYVDGETLSDYSVDLYYNNNAFMLVSSESAAPASGIVANLSDNASEGKATISYTVNNDPVEKHVHLYTMFFKAKAAKSVSTFYSFFCQASAGQNTAGNTFESPVKVQISHTHNFGSWSYSVQPSATEDGEKVRTCSECSFKESKAVAALNYTLQIKNDATQIAYDVSENTYYAIKPGCTVSELLAKFNYDSTVKVLDAKNKERSNTDTVCTNDKIVVYATDNSIANESLLSVYGDSDGDGKSTATDARDTLRASVSLYTSYNKAVYYAMDSDNDNKISSSDARFILRTSVSLEAFYAIEADAVSLNTNSLIVYTGSSNTLTATIAPVNVSVQSVSWTSSDEKIATVSNGRVFGVSAGTCTITASTRNGKRANCTVTVRQSVESVTQYRKNLYLAANQNLNLSTFYAVNPSDAYVADVRWTVNNAAFTVANGIVSCNREYDSVADKNATVTMTATGGVTASFNITLIPAGDSYCIINRETLSVPVGQTFGLKNTSTPSLIAKYTSDNPAVVKVNDDNSLTAVAMGTAKITCTTVKYTTTCTISVKSNAIKITSCYVDRTDGISTFILGVQNTSGKEITSMRFYVTGYTANGTQYKDRILCEVTNLAASAATKTFAYSKLWDGTNTVYTASITDITLKFADGTTQKLTTDQLLFG